ncbi:phage antirepressor N-terminal domain-containing protein [Acinetobacter sp. TR11]|uniref:phage antirepressor N-terminal domain-containing protein n=1 Tax=Acinetobacter sp. TR11 TaxID=3003393 RepID=UPI0022AC3F4B|nr:phage antirepressor N-terminal domain-containing protein [Acinetobacter sp. TR11]WAU73085.1 hypothetical protein O1450_13510 [Acinetobacter sp. TR11]
MNTKSKIVKFNNQQVPVFMQGDKPYVLMKPICENIGLDWNSQKKRINRNAVLSKGKVMMTSPSNGGDQEYIALPLGMLNGWLMGVDANKVRPEIKDTLIKYQLECYDVLYQHFMPKPRKPVDLSEYVRKDAHEALALKYHCMFRQYDDMIDQLRDKISSMEDQCRYLDYKLNQYAIDIYEASKLLNVPVSTIEYELLCSHFITKRVPYISDAPVIWSVTERGKRLGLVLIDSIIIDGRAVDLIKLTDDGFSWLKQRLHSQLNLN